MPFELDVRHESLSYVGRFEYPTFELWGLGGVITKGLYDSLASHGVTLQNFQVNAAASNLSDPVIVVRTDSGELKFAFDKIECTFTNFSVQFFESIPQLMSSAVVWIAKAVPGFKFASHSFSYFTHALVKDSTSEEVLKTINRRELKAGGISLGNGAIFNYSVPDKRWQSQLIIDRSQYLPGALFINLKVNVGSGDMEYAKLLKDGRAYLAGILEELGLDIPEASK